VRGDKKTITLTAAVHAAAQIAGGPALAQDKKNFQPSASPRGDASGHKTTAPEKIDGQITRVDQRTGMITVRNNDGTTHEFKGDPETLREYNVGDSVQLTLRAQPC
jgi:hypothetical protein